MNKINFVEKSLKMPHCNNVGIININGVEKFCSYNDDRDFYFDRVDEEFINNNLENIDIKKFTKLPRSIVKEEDLVLGSTVVKCSVLEDGRRVIKDTSLFDAFNRSRKGEVRIDGYPPILGSKTLVEIFEELYPHEIHTISKFDVAQFNGTTGQWYDANAIPIICDLYMEADKRGLIKPGQHHVLEQSKMLLRSLAKVGITALIDEATNYQDIRGKDELQILLSTFIADELQSYSKQFPKEYFEELFRLYGKPYDPTTTKRPRNFAQFNIKYVYKMLPPQVWDKIEEINPTILNPNTNKRDRKNHIHRNLTDEGKQWLQSHLSSLIPVMTISEDIEDFKIKFDKAFNRKIKELEKMESCYQLSLID